MKKPTAIQKSARGEDCTLRIPGVCNHDNSTVVLCHAPYPGKSGTRKHDHWAAYGCSACHDAADGRAYAGYCCDELFALWLPAIHETQMKLHEKGLIWLGGEYEKKVLQRR